MKNDDTCCNGSTCEPRAETTAAQTLAAAGLETAAPRVDTWTDEHGDRLLLDLPGVPRENVAIEIDGATLTVTATPETPAVDGRPLHAEWRAVRYERRFELSPRSDAGAVTASMDAGVLEIFVPRSAQGRRRTVTVTGATAPSAD